MALTAKVLCRYKTADFTSLWTREMVQAVGQAFQPDVTMAIVRLKA